MYFRWSFWKQCKTKLLDKTSCTKACVTVGPFCSWSFYFSFSRLQMNRENQHLIFLKHAWNRVNMLFVPSSPTTLLILVTVTAAFPRINVCCVMVFNVIPKRRRGAGDYESASSHGCSLLQQATTTLASFCWWLLPTLYPLGNQVQVVVGVVVVM